MTLYIDPLNRFHSTTRYKQWCHLMSNKDTDELHSFARSIGLKRAWFQDKKDLPHYDLTPGKRKLAIAKGAIEVSSAGMIHKCKT